MYLCTCMCCVGIMTCMCVSNISVDWSMVAVYENTSNNNDPVSGCIMSSVICVCTSYRQLVQCCNGRLSAAVDLPFNDASSIKQVQSTTPGTTLFIVESRGHMAALVDMSKQQVLLLLP